MKGQPEGTACSNVMHANTERELVLPNTHIETKLVTIWEELLKTKPIGIQDNFFELGGHSLMAVHLFSRIKEEFSVNLPLATLFREATVEYLARVIQQELDVDTWSSLIEIEPLGDHPPFFCVHGLTGDILWFRDLARCLAPNYPFYGLQSRGLDGVQQPIEQIEQMATHYVDEIRRVQPKGPYYLGGASFGGMVALEMAQQLLAKDEEVALLAIFDDGPVNVKIDSDSSEFMRRVRITYRILKNFPHWFKNFIQIGPSRMSMRIRRNLRIMQKSKDDVQAGETHKFVADDLIDFASELSVHRQQLITLNYQAMKKYVPKPYAGHVSLFRASSRPLLNTFDPEAGWQELAPGRVKVFDVPSSHEGMFKMPHVKELAQKLKACLDDVCS